MNNRYIYKDKVLFVRQDLSGKYRVFKKPIGEESDAFKAHVCNLKCFGRYDTFEQAQEALDSEALFLEWEDY